MTVHLYVGSPLSDCLPLCCCRTAPEVSEEEGSYASRFYCWFLESSKSCLLFLVALPGLIDTLAQLLAWRYLLWVSMTLQHSNFLSTASLAWSLAFVLFQLGEASTVEGNPYTHTTAVFFFFFCWIGEILWLIYGKMEFFS